MRNKFERLLKLSLTKRYFAKAATLVGAACFMAACTASSPTDALVTYSIPAQGPKFDDYDPQEFGYRRPESYPIHGIDISRWQTDVDWQTLRRSKIRFAFIKATEGGDHTDKLFQDHWNNAARARMPRAAYHFYYFCTSPEKQARWFIQNVPKSRTALPPILDIEWNHQSPSCKRKPDAATIQSEMRRFLTLLERHYGQKPLIYTTVDFFKDGNLANFQGYPFWLRSVANHPKNIYGQKPWLFWQYTGTGKVPGIKGKTDINVFAGSSETWANWVKSNINQ